ncbi:MAG: endonuclease III [Clostridiales bacterium]|nr:endonuclease III [Clostridiales bacterium]
MPVLIERLEKLYPDAGSALEYKNIFQLLISVVLSAQTTDISVNKVTPKLFEKYPDAASLAAADQNEVEDILRQIGLYKNKAKNIIALSKILIDEYDGQVPDDYNKLITLPGVGRKTANVVLAVGLGEPRIAVDTHVFRLSNRIGLTKEKDTLKTELALMKIIPKDHWIKMHHALIWHGRAVCSARNPKCAECGIEDLCNKNNL